MGRRLFLVVAFVFGAMTPLLANDPAETIVLSEQVLSDLMAIPGKQIPHRLLREAQGIVIVPNVVKIGFVAGARRGHGIAMVRDIEGEWSLPQFVTLTGGGVGWQAGVEGTDVVLVFGSRQGAEGLMRGKLTVGVDASVTAGPVGREAAIGTDSTFRSEVLSYSRSRGVFIGVSLDGTAIEVDHDAQLAFYGAPAGTLPRHVPGLAEELRHVLAELTPRHSSTLASDERLAPVVSPRLIDALRQSLNQNSEHLQLVLSPEWRAYLALPIELRNPGKYPSSESLEQAVRHFKHVSKSAEYHQLAELSEFQRTFELLQEYERAVMAAHPTLKLPPPPAHFQHN